MSTKNETPLAGGVSQDGITDPFRPRFSSIGANQQGGYVHGHLSRDCEASVARHILQFLPDVGGRELKIRSSLLKSADRALVIGCQSGGTYAAELAHDAYIISESHVYNRHVSVFRLEIAMWLCRRLVGAALAAQSLDAGEVSP